jgi:YHS domain-containing protein
MICTLQFCVFAALAEQQINLDSKGRVLHGYDPVSYYTGTPVKGIKDISYEYQGVRYLFASRENREEFIGNPGKYRFAYGGYCAWAMLDGEKVDVDPERFKQIDGVIYLFYNTFFTDTLDKWNGLADKESEPSLISRADEQWQKLIHP